MTHPDHLEPLRASDRVHQHWVTSVDAGKTWTTMFDGTYVKKKA